MSASKKHIRENFRDATFKRDGYRCRCCGRSQEQVALDAHHITDRTEMPNGGYVKENGISLCNEPHADGAESCHMKAEKFHISGGKEWEPGMHPDDLYKLVGSSYESAVKASDRLR